MSCSVEFSIKSFTTSGPVIGNSILKNRSSYFECIHTAIGAISVGWLVVLGLTAL